VGLTLVGFSGRPVVAGAGLKAVLVHDADTDQYAVCHAGRPGAWWSRSELADHESSALVTRLPAAGELLDDAVAIYAHTAFVAPPQAEPEPGDDGPMVLLQPAGLALYPGCESYVGYLPQPAAWAILDRWADTLLRAAKRALERRGRARPVAGSGCGTAFREAMRARYALAGRTDPQVQQRRREALVLAWADTMLRGGSTAALRRDAALECADSELISLEMEAARWFRAASRPPAVKCSYRDHAGPVHLQTEDAA